MINIEVVAAWPDSSVRVVIDVPAGTTLADAVALALAQSEELADSVKRLTAAAEGEFAWGVFGQQADPQWVLEAGARVELYRPLRRDPREARRLLASQGLNVTHAE